MDNEPRTTGEDRAAAVGNWIKEVSADMLDKAASTMEEFANTLQDNPGYLRDILEDNPLYLGLLGIGMFVLFCLAIGMFIFFLIGIGMFVIFFLLLGSAVFVLICGVFFIQHMMSDVEVEDSTDNSEDSNITIEPYYLGDEDQFDN